MRLGRQASRARRTWYVSSRRLSSSDEPGTRSGTARSSGTGVRAAYAVAKCRRPAMAAGLRVLHGDMANR